MLTFLIVDRQQIAMQQVIQARPNRMNSRATPSVLALLIMPAILSATNLTAQSRALQTIEAPQQLKTAVNPAPAHGPDPKATVVRSAAPPAPAWPANQPPNQARVIWGSRGLEIEASNSSLNQILHQVAADTGAKLEGLSRDQRVFGSYGPGPGADVLWKLLDDSGYNVLMIGGRDTDVPLEIVLSVRSPSGPQTVANNQNRSNAERLEPDPQSDDSAESSPPQPTQNPFGNGEQPRDPVKFMQEILQRQQQIDQQQDQQNTPQ